jgi:DNA modification methylase
LRGRPRARDAETSDPAFPKYRLERVDTLVPYAANARTHSPAQVDLLARLIGEYGFTNPVLTDGRRGIVAGHGRVLAARKLGMDVVPVIELSHLTAAQRRAYVIADNASALQAGWDSELLALELGELRDLGFDMALTGFDALELGTLLGDADGGLTEPDDVPAVEAQAVSRLGDVWLLGRHRLVCGDCTDADTVAKALAGATPHLMVTDPPYGVEYDPKWRNAGGVSRAAHGRSREHVVENDDRSDWREAWALFPGEVVYVWCASLHVHNAAESITESGFDLRSSIIWRKQHFSIGRGHYHWQHEPCWYAVRGGGTGHWQGDRTQTSVWDIHAPNGALKGKGADAPVAHSTQKPVDCMRRPIENNSAPGDAVYDPFVGSGTTIIAAESTGRVCHAIELHPQYVDVTVRRWQAFAGATATLEADGRTFAAIEAERTATK